MASFQSIITRAEEAYVKKVIDFRKIPACWSRVCAKASRENEKTRQRINKRVRLETGAVTVPSKRRNKFHGRIQHGCERKTTTRKSPAKSKLYFAKLSAAFPRAFDFRRTNILILQHASISFQQSLFC